MTFVTTALQYLFTTVLKLSLPLPASPATKDIEGICQNQMDEIGVKWTNKSDV